MSQDERPPVKLEPTKLDFALEAVAGLMIAALWGILILSWLFPESFLQGHDRGRLLMDSLGVSMLAAIFYHFSRVISTKDGFFIKITEENLERQCRFRATYGRFLFLYFCMSYFGQTCIRLLPLDDTDSFESAFTLIWTCLLLCIIIVLSVRTWQLR